MKTSPQSMSAVQWKSIALLLLVVLPLTRVATAWGEVAPADSVVTDTGLIASNSPVYSGSIRGDANRVSMSNSFSNALALSNGLKMKTSIRINEVNYRDPDRDRSDQSKDLSHSIIRLWESGFMITGMLSENRLSNRIVTFDGDLQNFIVNTRQASVNASYGTAVSKNVRMKGMTDVRVFNKEQVGFKTDNSLEGAAAGGIMYRYGDRVKAKARGFIKKSDDRAESGVVKFQGLGLAQDSLSSEVTLQVTDSASVGFEYIRYNSSREYIDLPRGTFLEPDYASEQKIREKQLTDARVFEVKAEMSPVHGLKLKMNASHSDQGNEFAEEQRKSSRTIGDYLTGDVSYALGKKTSATFSLERREVLHDLGPQSLSSYNEEGQNITATLQQTITATFSFSLVASTGLIQNYYIDYDVNPRDRDQLNQKLSMNISSRPFSKVNTNISLSATSIEFVNIDASLSGQNRKETTYDLRPSITYQLNERVTIKQDYGLNIEFTEYAFDENENDLDR
ncbi:MAG: hypothetical protein ABIA59_05000, partial [Candidatus Latescibacterota bacterium]